MNIFVLDSDVRKCARYHADQHVIKMILESTQMLCTALHRHGVDAPYKPTHRNHPCTLWAGDSLANWKWLRRLALALNDEYRYRFGDRGDHSSAVVARDLQPPPIENVGLTEFAQAMPEKYRVYIKKAMEVARFHQNMMVLEQEAFLLGKFEKEFGMDIIVPDKKAFMDSAARYYSQNKFSRRWGAGMYEKIQSYE